jgi:hypothetical protein
MDSFDRILLESGFDILLEDGDFLRLEIAPDLITSTIAASAEAYGEMAVAQLIAGTMTVSGEAYGSGWQMSYQVVSVRGIAYDYSGPYALIRDESEGYP